jgi:hypothetical protein
MVRSAGFRLGMLINQYTASTVIRDDRLRSGRFIVVNGEELPFRGSHSSSLKSSCNAFQISEKNVVRDNEV